jgi:hypothetical protein
MLLPTLQKHAAADAQHRMSLVRGDPSGTPDACGSGDSGADGASTGRSAAPAAAAVADGGGERGAAVGCGAFLAAWEATWLHERYFLALRASAFDDKRLCERGDGVSNGGGAAFLRAPSFLCRSPVRHQATFSRLRAGPGWPAKCLDTLPKDGLRASARPASLLPPPLPAGAGMDALRAALRGAAEELPMQGWPVPEAEAMRRVADLVSRGGARPAFAFGDLVRRAAGSAVPMGIACARSCHVGRPFPQPPALETPSGRRRARGAGAASPLPCGSPRPPRAAAGARA